MKQRKLLTLVVAGILCLGLMVAVLPSKGAYAEVINLKFANFFPPPAGQSKICQEFIAELEKRTKGRVEGSILCWGFIAEGSCDVQRGGFGNSRHRLYSC